MCGPNCGPKLTAAAAPSLVSSEQLAQTGCRSKCRVWQLRSGARRCSSASSPVRRPIAIDCQILCGQRFLQGVDHAPCGIVTLSSKDGSWSACSSACGHGTKAEINHAAAAESLLLETSAAQQQNHCCWRRARHSALSLQWWRRGKGAGHLVSSERPRKAGVATGQAGD